MCAAAVTGGDVLIKNVIPKHLEAKFFSYHGSTSYELKIIYVIY